MTTKFGPWIKLYGDKKPENLKDDQMIEAVFLGRCGGGVQTVDFPREAIHHDWGRTLAYRVEQVETLGELYGTLGNGWSVNRFPPDTHKITYTFDQDGNVLSCKMEQLK